MSADVDDSDGTVGLATGWFVAVETDNAVAADWADTEAELNRRLCVGHGSMGRPRRSGLGIDSVVSADRVFDNIAAHCYDAVMTGPAGTLWVDRATSMLAIDLYCWHVDDVEAAVARLLALGATSYGALTVGGADFVTAAVRCAR